MHHDAIEEGRTPPPRWGIILAGGDGVRLRSLTRRIASDDRPKQFCSILEGETMLAATRRRLALAVPPAHTVVAVTETHERFYAPLLADLPRARLLEQPANRGTAPAILYGLLRIVGAAPTAAIAIQPSDHFVSDDAAFMRYVELAFHAVAVRPHLVVLLGVTPEYPEPEYGWIDPGELIPDAAPARWARGFCEKPSPALAVRLLARGALWNSFVVVARLPTLAVLIQRTVPALFRAFAPVLSNLDTPREEDAVRMAYSRLETVDFARCVLVHQTHALAVIPVQGVSWSDWGSPRRVVTSMRRLGITPRWASARSTG